MGGGKAPRPPDTVGAAEAQGEANVEAARITAALNRVNQVGPNGTVSYSQDPNNPDSFTQTTTLSPEQQALYNSNTYGQQQRTDLGNRQLGMYGQQIGTGINTEGLPQLQSSANPTDQVSGINARSVATGRIPTANLPRFERQQGQQYQQGLDYSSATQLPGNEDFGAERQRVEDAMYGRGASRLDDQFSRREEDQRSQLINRGLREGTEAYANAERDLNQSRTDAYGDLRDRAINAGSQEQSRLFSQALAARQQGVGETTQQGQFANDAAQLGNQYGLQRRQQAASERGQAFGENTTQANFGNAATQQNFSNELARGAFQNDAQQQEFTQRLAQAQLQNQTRAQGVGEQQINQDQQLQGLNFLYGGGYQPAQFANGADGAAGGVQAPDIIGALNQQYQGQADAYSADQARRSSNTQAGIGAAATIGAVLL